MRPNANKPILITVFICLLLLCAVLVPIKKEVKTLPPLQGLTYQDLTEDQKREFNNCIELHPSDYVCDSCMTVIAAKK